MHLERDQEKALAGELGPAAEWAMGALCRLGDRQKAARLVAVRSVHVPDWCGRPFPGPVPFGSGGSFPTYTTANPGGEEGKGQKGILESLGLRISYTCTPYLVGNHPNRGEVVAWGGRAAVSFVNSIIGARSEMETCESAMASAITGLTPERGLHLEENRKPTVAVIANDKVDLTALGFVLSRELHDDVPLLCGVKPTFDEAKRLSFSLNARGTVPLFNIQRTPEPPHSLEKLEISKGDLEAALGHIIEPDLIILGCPHLSEQDINRWSKKVAGRPSSKTEVWFFTSRLSLDKCPIFGAVLRARGRTFVDTCPLAMRRELTGRSIACDSPGLAECLNEAGLKVAYLPDAELLKLMVQAV